MRYDHLKITRSLKWSFCVLALLILSVPVQAQSPFGPCETFRGYYYYTPGQPYEPEQIRDCVSEIKAKYPVAWKVLTQEKNPAVISPSAAELSVALLVEAGNPCTTLKWPWPNRNRFPKNSLSFLLDQRDRQIKAGACMKDLEMNHPESWKTFEDELEKIAERTGKRPSAISDYDEIDRTLGVAIGYNQPAAELNTAVPVALSLQGQGQAPRPAEDILEELESISFDEDGFDAVAGKLKRLDSLIDELGKTPEGMNNEDFKTVVKQYRRQFQHMISLVEEAQAIAEAPRSDDPGQTLRQVERMLEISEEIKGLEIDGHKKLRWPALPGSLPPWIQTVILTWITIILWARGARVVFFFIGRRLGVVDLSWFRYWLWVFPWRPVYRAWMVPVRWWRRLKYGKGGNSSWAGLWLTMAFTFKKGDCVYVGKLAAKRGIPLFQPVGIKGPRHMVIVAGSGAGKTTQLMTMLGTLHKSASAFVVDCDGQMVRALGPALERAGHRVVLLDPYHLVKGFPGGHWNPIDEITRAAERHGHDAAVRFAQKLAEGLIRELEPRNAWVYKEGRTFMAGLILYVWLYEKEKTVVRVRQLLTTGLPERALPKEHPFTALLRVMKETPDFGGAIAAAASVIEASQSGDGKNAPRTTCIDQTGWLDQPEMTAISRTSDVCGEDLKLANTVVFMAAPLTDIQSRLSSWVRALTMMTMYAFENMPGKLKIPCLFALDEMPSLGRIEVLATSAPAFRKYGIRLVVVTQDLQRLQKAYPEEWRGFFGNAECAVWMGLGVEDGQTLKFLSEEVLGKCMTREKIEGSHFLLRWLGLSKIPARYQKIERWLMDPQQLTKFLHPMDGNIIVTRFGGAPLMLKHGPYYTELPFWAFEPDPAEGESFLRARVREVFSWLFPKRQNATMESPELQIESEPFVFEPPAAAPVVTALVPKPEEPFVFEPPISTSVVTNLVPKAARLPVFEERFNEHFDPTFGTFPDTGVRTRVSRLFDARLKEGGKYYDLCRAFLDQFDPGRAIIIGEREEVLTALGQDFRQHFMKKKKKVA